MPLPTHEASRSWSQGHVLRQRTNKTTPTSTIASFASREPRGNLDRTFKVQSCAFSGKRPRAIRERLTWPLFSIGSTFEMLIIWSTWTTGIPCQSVCCTRLTDYRMGRFVERSFGYANREKVRHKRTFNLPMAPHRYAVRGHRDTDRCYFRHVLQRGKASQTREKAP